MKAFEIDCFNRVISEIEVKDFTDMQQVVKGRIERAHTFENGDELYVNEEGLLGSPEFFFVVVGAHQPFAGNGVVLGFDRTNGESKSALSDLEDLKKNIRFIRLLK